MSNHQPAPAELPRGIDLLHDPTLNKGTSFTAAERDALGLRGLLPPRIFTQAERAWHVMDNIRCKENNLAKYLYLVGLQDRNEKLFYRVLIRNMTELSPIVYTPTVGLACQEYSRIFRRPRGIFISKYDRNRVEECLRNWSHREVRVIVVTDGERILGLGDLGANGMGIPIGKLSLYTACAGIDPGLCLPVMIDVGTNNPKVSGDPCYIGLPEPRLRGEEYDALIDEFMAAVARTFPRAMIQFEDFGNLNAFRLLERYRDRYRTFNDDIQGTAAMTLAGLYSALRMIGGRLDEQRIVILGAGSAAVGIGNLIVSALTGEGLSAGEARRRCWFLDSKGLVVSGRTDLSEQKRRFARDDPPRPDLLAVVEAVKPTAIIGASGQRGTFTRAVLEAMARINRRPIVLALSNPTSRSECTAEEAYRFTEGRAVFASGSQFPEVAMDGRTFVPGQANNSYIFPGVGLAILATEASRVTDEMFAAAARALEAQVTEEDFEVGRIYPALSRIREVSVEIALAVARIAFAQGLAAIAEPADLAGHIRSKMYDAVYRSYV
ncbi:MAG: NAD-dependent malic enzyme [Deltaproteobacteria bacterium]|nr:NAD-dependent malic enzyme [Deltaproteobacteria bacterium]